MMKKKIWSEIGLLLLLFYLSSCATVIQRPSPGEEAASFQLVSGEEWPDLKDDLELKDLDLAILQSLAYLKSRPPGYKFLLGTREISAQEMVSSLDLFLEIHHNNSDGKSREHQIKAKFDLVRIVRNNTPLPLLITGYYEPSLQGSRRPSPRFRYPVYRLPDDLLIINPRKFSPQHPSQKWVGRIVGNEVIPYYTRQEIDQEGLLTGKNFENLWVDDPLKLFFMHIQGSGEVVFEDGSMVKLGYQGTNGHPYFALGKELIRRGIIQPEELSLQSIYTYLQDHPQEQQALMNLNPSYIFFKEVRGGPYGSLGRPLTPGRSVAMDLKIFPPAGLAWLKGVQPTVNDQGQIQAFRPLGRWVLIQDSGGAIKGPSRLDLFWGNGPEAEIAAGHLRHQGAIFLLLKK
ncbi:MAG: MltA domain-containing protein [Pseudomonadota bacterium]